MTTRLYKIVGMSKREIEATQRMIKESREYYHRDPGVYEHKDDSGKVIGFKMYLSPWKAFKTWIEFTIENMRKKTRLRITRVKSI